MKTSYNFLRNVFSFIAILSLALSAFQVQPQPVLAQGGDGGIQHYYNTESGKVTRITGKGNEPLTVMGAMSTDMTPAERSDVLVQTFAPEFGLTSPSEELTLADQSQPEADRVVTKYQQVYNGVPVLGGELIVNASDQGELYSMNGEVSQGLSLDTNPAISVETAIDIAKQGMTKWYGGNPEDYTYKNAELSIFDESLIGGAGLRPAELVWRLDLTPVDAGQPIREFVLVNAKTGNIAIHFNQVDGEGWSYPSKKETSSFQAIPNTSGHAPLTVNALAGDAIRIYTASNGTTLPGTLLCTEADASCTGGVDLHADKAQEYTKGVRSFYKSQYDLNGMDGNGITTIATVHYSMGYENAFWDGAQMVFGDAVGYPLADDVVAHEYTHGVIEHASNLFYYYQSGAINESFSDLWGEYYDQTNGLGNDLDDVKWLIGEDVAGRGANRSMSNPPLYGDPDKMTSSLYNKKAYYEDSWDNGGVHSNSGINNKAVYLMVNGGTFNGKTVTALGWEKVGFLYYDALRWGLTSGSDYSDLYYTLINTCPNNVGLHGLTIQDCAEVKDALDAVQMNSQPTANFNPDTPLCPAGMNTDTNLYFFDDDFEDQYTTGSWALSSQWGVDDFYATSDTRMLYGDDDIENSVADAVLTLPPSLPAGSFLHFKHAFGFETDGTSYWDGGVLEYFKGEYKEDGAPIWRDIKPLFDTGKNYNATISPASSNALKGQPAFAGESHGYVSSRYNLSSLAGQDIQLRWRLATDESDHNYGWFIDDVRVYACVGLPSIPTLKSPVNNALIKGWQLTALDWTDVPTVDHYEIQVATDSKFSALVYEGGSIESEHTIDGGDIVSNTKYYWRVRGINVANGGVWSAPRYFRTALWSPAVISPVSGDPHIHTLRPTFDWDDVIDTGVTGYTIQISKNSTFTQLVQSVNRTVSNYTPNIDLPRNTILYWRVRTNGANGPSEWSPHPNFAADSYFESANSPTTPTLSLPANNVLSTNYLPLFKWSVVTQPAPTAFAYYQLQVDNDADFSSPELNDMSVTNILTPQFQTTAPSPFAPNTKYYWRVRGVNTDEDVSNWSIVRTFRTTLLPPALVLPADPFASKELRPLFDWDPPAGPGKITGYTIQIAKDTQFKQIVHTGNPVGSFYTPTVDLLKNATLYWRVLAKGDNGPSAYSGYRSFTTPVNPPPTPVLLTPAANFLSTDTTPTFTWKPVVMPSGTFFQNYILQVDDSADFSSPVVNDNTVVTTTFTPGGDLATNTKFYWRVRAVNTSGEMGNWSAVRTIRAAILPPTVAAPVDGATGVAKQPLLDWSDVPGNSGYILQVYKAGTTPTLVKSVTLATNVSQYQFLTNLLPNTAYFWKVQTKGANGPSSWSEHFDFTTGP